MTFEEHEVELPSQEKKESQIIHIESDNIDDFPYPAETEEEWRFTNISAYDELINGEQLVNVVEKIHLEGTHDYSIIDATDARISHFPKPHDRLSYMAFRDAQQVLYIPVVGENDEPIRITVTSSPDTVSTTRICLDIKPFARRTISINYNGSGKSSSLLQLEAGEGSNVHLIPMQTLDDTAVFGSTQSIVASKDSTVQTVAVSLGAQNSRISSRARYSGTGGDVDLNGLYFSTSGQWLEHRVMLDHNQPKTKGRVTYKGALQGQTARSVWIGDAIIRTNAEGTDSYEMNRNLLLTKGARADSVPNLEIETGNIEGAGHASANGRFDEEQLFYLMARGIDEQTAKQLVVHGFFAEVINLIPLEEERNQLMNIIEQKLNEPRK